LLCTELNVANRAPAQRRKMEKANLAAEELELLTT
jgi:hypothetical protein